MHSKGGTACTKSPNSYTGLELVLEFGSCCVTFRQACGTLLQNLPVPESLYTQIVYLKWLHFCKLRTVGILF